MSKNITKLPTADSSGTAWAALLEEMKEEYWTSEQLSEDEKRFLDHMEDLPEEDWEPIACAGESVSKEIIEERGAQ